MSTSGTYDWSLDVDEIAQRALARIGGEQQPGYDARAARFNLQLMLQEWSNQGVSMAARDQVVLPVTGATASYTLPAEVLDVLELHYRGTDGQDSRLDRIPRDVYADLPNKAQAGGPTQWFLDRRRAAPVLYVWPVLATADGSYVYWRQREFQDVATLAEHIDLPRRFMPAAVSGLAYYMSEERPDVAPDRRAALEARYRNDLRIAIQADQDGPSIFILPGIS